MKKKSKDSFILLIRFSCCEKLKIDLFWGALIVKIFGFNAMRFNTRYYDN